MGVTENVAGREVAESIIEDLEYYKEDENINFDSLALKLVEYLQPWITAPEEKIVPMSDDETYEFDEVHINFGAFNGCKTKHLELRYLINLTEKNDYIEQAKRYLKSSRIKNLLRQQDLL